ncbi:MAG: prepilin-type N-terminal cleavage/methylation domain-containing protein [Candidatus Manganitrophaceae bacterium]
MRALRGEAPSGFGGEHAQAGGGGRRKPPFRRSRIRSGAEGFSLLEVMVAMTILFVGLLGVIGLFQTGFKALQMGAKKELAVRLAQNKMEALRASDVASAGEESDTTEGMVRRWSVRPSGSDPRIRVIEVAVAWHDAGDRERTVSLKGFVFY